MVWTRPFGGHSDLWLFVNKGVAWLLLGIVCSVPYGCVDVYICMCRLVVAVRRPALQQRQLGPPVAALSSATALAVPAATSLGCSDPELQADSLGGSEGFAPMGIIRSDVL
jgi:hypothetical protein